MNLNYIIIRPVVTEKSLEDSKLGRYTFRVARKANKHQIATAIKVNFQVDAVKIHSITKKGLIKRTGRKRLPSNQPTTKKVIVDLKKGQSIKIFESQE